MLLYLFLSVLDHTWLQKDVQPLIILPQMVISQLKDVRTASKAFSTAQSSAMQVARSLEESLFKTFHIF